MLGSWDILQEMEALRRDFETFFENGGRGRGPGRAFRSSFLPGLAARAYPLLNIHEDADALRIVALAPGLDTGSLTIQVQDGQLRLEGAKHGHDENIPSDAYHRVERAAGRFVRTIGLPWPVDEDKAQADYRDGILTVTLPKAEAAKPRQIAVHVN